MDFNVSALSAFIVAFATLLAAGIAVAGYVFGKRARAEDKAERFGRLEGWQDAEGNKRLGGDSVSYSVGGLKEAVDNIKSDIQEIRRSQESDTRERAALRESFNKMQGDVAALRRSFQELSRKVNRRMV